MKYKELEEILIEIGFKDSTYETMNNSGRYPIPILELKGGRWDFNFMYFKEGTGIDERYRCRIVTGSKNNIMCNDCKDKTDVIIKLIKYTQEKSYNQGEENVKSKFRELFDIIQED
jgi:hypothetical protein